MRVSWSAFKGESNQLIKLALPILLAQLALTGLGVVDTIMSGRVGTNDLAAVGLGTNIMLPVFMFATGVLLAITPIVSKAKGQNNLANMQLYFYQGLWLALPLGLLSLVILMNLNWLLDLLSLNPSVYQLTEEYLFYIAFGMPGVALYQALRFFWEGLGKTLPTMWISFFALFLNIPLNAIFIYGFGPIDAMGAAGCGVASTIVMWSMLIVAMVYIMKSSSVKPYIKNAKSLALDWHNGVKPILALGLPNSFALLFEVSLFSFIALFIAPLGATVIAAHQIAINFTSLAFMVPLSFAMALTVRVGYGFGESKKNKVQTTLFTGFLWALVIGVLLALVSFIFRVEIVEIYTLDKQVLALATILLLFAAMYQVFDAIQVCAAGALRGFHDTKVTMWVTLFSYWGVGLGLGYIFTFTDWFVPALGVQGFWLGIVLGLTLAAILLSIRLRVVYRANFK
ncbi:putative multidrug resistance protein NorM [Thiomicrorhabdus immobilis]|uniref:Multidrug-efflux transporter n=1 Tax=Thiomicrorhabdus immobilis TaxID=2791037 RepID=A0ABN6D0B1_9GAMM|nr:MATE family efflux transporter [Thiomicrorhabdus immobilis]BCN93364.1 putative multidrug resistance protein NorM [Thiomicrorhabdus immobilis]